MQRAVRRRLRSLRAALSAFIESASLPTLILTEVR